MQSIINLVTKFEKPYALHDKPRSGRPSLMEERVATVQDAVDELQAANPHGHASSSHIATATDIPERSVRRILREHLCLFPYHLGTSQAVTEADKKARLDFVNRSSDHDNLIDSILWSDEAYFTLDGCVNKHNCIIWGLEKPQRTLPRHLHSPKVCVWMESSSTCKLQPFFFPATVTGENYLELIRDHVIPQLRQQRKLGVITFQHDGAPPHYSTHVRDFLRETFSEDRIIARGIGHRWPARSPDLSPLDYWFWGMIKARVYHFYKPSNLVDLQQCIRSEIEKISLDEIANAVRHVRHRVELVRKVNGGTFSYLL